MQEERQRGKDRSESEVESTSSANEDMPVEKILEAELAVEPKTETYVEATMGLNPSSVSAAAHPPASAEGTVGPGQCPGEDPPAVPTRRCSRAWCCLSASWNQGRTVPLTLMLHMGSGRRPVVGRDPAFSPGLQEALHLDSTCVSPGLRAQGSGLGGSRGHPAHPAGPPTPAPGPCTCCPC